jgi:hypothetical protein
MDSLPSNISSDSEGEGDVCPGFGICQEEDCEVCCADEDDLSDEAEITYGEVDWAAELEEDEEEQDHEIMNISGDFYGYRTIETPSRPILNHLTFLEAERMRRRARKFAKAKYEAGDPFFSKEQFQDVVRQIDNCVENLESSDRKVTITGLDGNSVEFRIRIGEETHTGSQETTKYKFTLYVYYLLFPFLLTSVI